jgi:adenylate cyclase class IV
VPLADDDEMVAEAEAHALLKKLGVAQSDLVPVAYVDLLNPPCAGGKRR